MTQTLETQMERQLNLDYFYEAAKRAITTKDFKQARSLASSGLEEAKELNNAHWLDLYSELLSKIPDSKPKKKRKIKNRETLSEKKIDNDLTKIGGIGPKLEAILNEHGVKTIHILASKAIEELSEINGIGPTTAQKMLNNAKDYLQKKDQSKGQVITKDVDSKENRTASPIQNEVEVIPYEKEEQEKKLSKVEPSQEKPKPKKIRVDALKQAKNTLKSKISLKKATIQKIELKEKLGKFGKAGKKVLKKSYQNLKKFIESRRDKEEDDVIRLREIMILKESVDQLLAQDYYYINLKKNPQKEYPEVDLIALKQLVVEGGTSLIILHPIRYVKIEKPLFITKNRVKLGREEELPSSHASIFKELSKNYFKVKSNLSKGGILFKVIKNEYFPNLKLKKTITGRPFFLLSDKTQVKVVIEPIVLTSKNVENSSKFNSFSFSKQHSMYITYKEDLEELLLYLKQKYGAMEIANVSEKPLKKYVNCSQTFNKHLQFIGVPFLIVGIILSILFMIPLNNHLLAVFTYPTIILYCTLLFITFFNYLRKTREITKDFYSPLYESPIRVKKSNISSLGEKLEKRYLEQFLYEFDTRKEYHKLRKSEKKKDVSSKQKQPKEKKKNKGTEKEPLNTLSKKKGKGEKEDTSIVTEDPEEPSKKKIKGEINPENFSFFLED